MSVPAGAGEAASSARRLELIGPASAIEVTAATTGSPQLERTIDGATTLTLDLLDGARTAARSGALDSRSFLIFDGVHLELAAVRKSGDAVTLTLEDAIVAALRRQTSPRTFAAGTATVQTIAAALAAEAGVRIACDPTGRQVVADAVKRSEIGPRGGAAQVSDSWSVLGQLAEDRGWRCFSDGDQLVFGSDDWLMSRVPAVQVREHVGAVHDVDWDLDTGKEASTATVDVDVDLWSVPPGLPLDVLDAGPASGRWLVESYERPVFEDRGQLKLTRARASLMEPPPSDSASSDQGEADFLPDAAASTARDPAPRSARAAEGNVEARERMLRWATQHAGTPYKWGGSGPDSVGYDCSGYVQEATRAAGKVLVKPASHQWSQAKTGALRVLTVEEGLRTRGAILWRLDPSGRSDHVVISTGDGFTLEARGVAYPNGRYPSKPNRVWTHAALWV